MEVDLDKLNFNRRYYTANGVSMGALLKIKEISFGNNIIKDINVIVMSNPNNKDSLIGMDIISRFDLSFYDDVMVLQSK
ncbi:MAG TPA: retropepsin-like aspartic protease [Candidatus Megaira endosymbiont of Hartmannula sinica]|nr:retropepsin-like aspartic protease [Candidatus Megaera endosymbiont of Hartmannula sinica]